MHHDRRLVVERHPPLPVGVIFVPLRLQDRCWFGLVRSAEGLLQDPRRSAPWGCGSGMACSVAALVGS